MDLTRSFSWSAISSFEWNKEQWWNKYVLHKNCKNDRPEQNEIAFCFVTNSRDPECPVVKKTIELAFGSMIDERLQNDPEFLPDVVRYPILQHKMKVEYNGIPLIGVADTFRRAIQPNTNALRDYKTGRKAWDQKRADDTGQLTMYCLLLWLIEKIRPEEIELYIDWLPTHIVDADITFVEPVAVHTFKTKRTMRDVLKFGQRITDTYAEMIEYCQHRPLLETSDWSQW